MSFAFFEQSSGSKRPSTFVLCAAVHEASREATGEDLQGCKHLTHTHVPVTLDHYTTPDRLHASISGSGGARDPHLYPPDALHQHVEG